MADPQVTGFTDSDAPPPSTGFTDSEAPPPTFLPPEQRDALDTKLKQADPEANAKLEIARHFSSLGLSPTFAYKATKEIGQSLYKKELDAPSLWEKVKNSFVEMPRLQARKDELAGLQYLGNNSPDVEQEIKGIDSKLSTKKGLGDIPDMVVGGLYQLGYTGYHAAGWLADEIAGSLSLNMMGHVNYSGMAQEEANRVFGSLVGGMYRGMMDRGFDPTVARLASGSLAVGNLALLMIPGGEAARPLEESIVQGVARAGLKGALQEGLGSVAKFLGMDAATARIAGAFGKQGIFALGSSLWNNVIPEVSGWLSNELARTNVPLKSLGKLGEDIAKSTGVQFLTAATIPMAKEAIRATLTNRVNEALSKFSNTVESTDNRESTIASWLRSETYKKSGEQQIPRAGAEVRPFSEVLKDVPESIKEQPARKSRDTIFDGEVPHDTEGVIQDAVKKIVKPFTTRRAAGRGASPDVRTLLGRLPGKIRGVVSPVLFSHDFNAEMVFGGKDNVAYRVAAGHPVRSEMEVRPRAAELSQEVTDWARTNGLVNPRKLGSYAMQEFTKDEVTLTRQEVLSAQMHFRVPEAQEGGTNKAALLSGAYIDRAADPKATVERPISEATYQKFFNDPEIIGEKEKDLLDRASRSIEEAGKVRAANHYKLHGEELPLIDQYWRKLVYRGGVPSEKDLEIQQERARWMQVLPDESSSNVREPEAIGPIHLRGFFQEYPEIMYDTALLEKMGPSLQQAGKVLWDNRVTEAVTNKFGRGMVSHMQDTVLKMAGRGRSPQAVENLFNEIYRLTVTTDMGLNVRAPIKQAFLAARSLPYVGTKQWLGGLMDSVVHPRRTRELAKRISMAYRQARTRGGTIELDTVLANAADFNRHRILRTILNVKQSFQKIGMSLTKQASLFSFKADTMAAWHGTQAEFETALRGGSFTDDFRAATGLKEEQVPQLINDKNKMFEAAGKYADYIIGESHATSYVGQRAGLLQTPIGKFAGIFKSEPMKALEQWSRALMQATEEAHGGESQEGHQDHGPVWSCGTFSVLRDGLGVVETVG